MKFGFVFSMLLLLCVDLTQAQDKIITAQNDTIYCRIVSISNERIYYEQSESNGIAVGKSLPSDQVTKYYRNTIGSSIQYINQTTSKSQPRHRWRFGLQGSIGYMLANTGDDENDLVKMGVNSQTAKDLCKDLSWGYGYGADMHYLFTDWGGIGIKYMGFYSATQADVTINIFDGINYLYTNMQKRVYVNFIGTSFYVQEWLDESNTFKFTSNIAFGYAHYRDEEEYDHPSINNYLITGSTFGGNVEMGFEYFPLSWLSISATAGYFGAWVGKITASDASNKQTIKLKDYDMDKINVSRLDFSVGVRFYL